VRGWGLWYWVGGLVGGGWGDGFGGIKGVMGREKGLGGELRGGGSPHSETSTGTKDNGRNEKRRGKR